MLTSLFQLTEHAHNLLEHAHKNNSSFSQLADFKYFYALFEEYLPNKTVFPTFGNHDVVPVNGYPQPFIKGNLSSSWIVEPTIGNWSKWLAKFPGWNNTQATIRRYSERGCG